MQLRRLLCIGLSLIEFSCIVVPRNLQLHKRQRAGWSAESLFAVHEQVLLDEAERRLARCSTTDEVVGADDFCEGIFEVLETSLNGKIPRVVAEEAPQPGACCHGRYSSSYAS